LYNKQQDSLQSVIGLLNNQKPGTLASLHVTRKDDFDFIFYLPLAGKNGRMMVEAATEEWRSKPGVRSTQRVFNAVTIHELSTSGSVFSWTFLDNLWVGSFTPFLIEDVIRTYGSKERSAFRRNLGGIYQMPKLKNDAGNLYVHLQNFSRWLSVFSPTLNADLVRHFGKAAVLDIKAAEENIVLNGFSVEENNAGSVLSVFNGQFPTSFGVKQYVSNRTVMLATYGISEGGDFRTKLSRYPERKKIYEDTLSQLSNSLGVNLTTLYSTIDIEVAMCYDKSREKQLSIFLIVDTESSEEGIS